MRAPWPAAVLLRQNTWGEFHEQASRSDHVDLAGCCDTACTHPHGGGAECEPARGIGRRTGQGIGRGADQGEEPGSGGGDWYARRQPHGKFVADADRRDLRRRTETDRHDRPDPGARTRHSLAELPVRAGLGHLRVPAAVRTAWTVAGPGAGAGGRQALASGRAGVEPGPDRPGLAGHRSQHDPAVGDRPHRSAARWRLRAIRLRRAFRRGQHHPEEGCQGWRRAAQRRPVLRR